MNYTFRGDSRGSSVSAYGLVDDSIEVAMNGRPVRWISPVRTYELFVAHPEMFPLNSTAIQYQAQNSKRMVEDITAGFLRFDLKLLRNRLNITTGVRYEKTGLDGWSMKRDNSAIYQRDANGDFVRDAKGKLALIVTDATERAKLTYQERGLQEQQSYDGFYAIQPRWVRCPSPSVGALRAG